MAKLVILLCALAALAVITECSSPSTLEAEEIGGAPQEEHVVKFLMRDSTGGAAEAKLERDWSFQVKGRSDRKDGLVETFGHHGHSFELKKRGFELLETHEGGGFNDPGYLNPKQIHKEFRKLEKKHPGQAKIINLTRRFKTPKTHEGRSIYALKVSDNVHKDESEPNVLLVSNHHARELITPELALKFGRELLGGYARATQAEKGELGESVSAEEMAEARANKKIVDKNQVYIMWTMNPDGLNTVWKNNAWKRTNSRGVDLNRNYPVGWATSCGGSTQSGGEMWRGKKPFSEPETKTMRAFQDNRNFAKLMDFHSYSGDVRTQYPKACASLPKKVDKTFADIRNKVANKMKYGRSRTLYMGGDIHYSYNRHGTLSYLTETGTAFQPPAKEKDATIKQVWPGVQKFLQQPIRVSGVIKDKKTGKPIKAKLGLPDYKWNFNEKKASGKRGHYHLWVPPGKHKLTVNAPGKPTKHLNVVAKESGTVKHIQV